MQSIQIPTDPTTWRIFEYTFKDVSLDECVVTIECDKSFNIHLISGKLIDSLNIDVSCEKMKNYPPLLHGQLLNEARDISVEYDTDNSKVKVHIFKKEKKEWVLCIIKQSESDNMIDPNSAFILADIILKEGSATEQGIGLARNYLTYCFQVNFPMALFQQAIELLNSGDVQHGLQVLSMLIQDYSYPSAYFLFGAHMIGLQDNESVDQGIELLKKAAELGSYKANLLLGKVYSPFDPSKYPQKDAKLSLSYFEKSTTPENPSMDALFEMARIYKKGFDNVPKDDEKAESLYEQAKHFDIDNTLPKLEENNSKSKILGGIISVGALAVFGAAVYLHFKKRR